MTRALDELERMRTIVGERSDQMPSRTPIVTAEELIRTKEKK